VLRKSNSRPGSFLPTLGTYFFVITALAFLSAIMAEPSSAQFKNRYSNLPSVTGFGSTGSQYSRPAQQQYTRQPQQQFHSNTGAAKKPAAQPTGPGGVYPEVRNPHGLIRWIPDQMPLKVYVSNGLAIDSILDPALGAPYTNTDHVDKWPAFVASVLQNREQFDSLPQAQGYVPQHRAAAIEGINYWKRFEKEGLLSFGFTDDPMEADIHVFFVNHFVGQLGMGLFANDIRGYTSKNCFPYKEILAGKRADFKPVVILLRCAEKNGEPMPIVKMRAASGHEFGHALGVDGHSKNPGDLMSMYYGNGTLSPSDIATIRYLYKSTPDLIP
jgi:hypothetical protein